MVFSLSNVAGDSVTGLQESYAFSGNSESFEHSLLASAGIPAGTYALQATSIYPGQTGPASTYTVATSPATFTVTSTPQLQLTIVPAVYYGGATITTQQLVSSGVSIDRKMSVTMFSQEPNPKPTCYQTSSIIYSWILVNGANEEIMTSNQPNLIIPANTLSVGIVYKASLTAIWPGTTGLHQTISKNITVSTTIHVQ